MSADADQVKMVSSCMDFTRADVSRAFTTIEEAGLMVRLHIPNSSSISSIGTLSSGPSSSASSPASSVDSEGEGYNFLRTL